MDLGSMIHAVVFSPANADVRMAIYLALAYGCFAICFWARAVTMDADRILRCMFWVLFFLGLGRVVGAVVPKPWSMILYPAEDMFLMVQCLAWAQVRGERWAKALGALYFAELALHLTYWAPALVGGHPHGLPLYIVVNNVCFLISLATLYVAGGGHVLHWCRDRLQLLRHRSRRWAVVHSEIGKAP